MAFDDGGLAVQNPQHIAFRACVHTGAAADAPFEVDMWMLRLGSVGKQLTVFGRRNRSRLSLSMPNQVTDYEEQDDYGCKQPTV
jgi:hypothetical protein